MPSTAIAPFGTDVGERLPEDVNRHPGEVGVSSHPGERAGGVHVSLHEMPTDACVGAHRALQVHRHAASKRAEGGHVRRFGADVERDRVAVTRDDRETDPVDSEACPPAQLGPPRPVSTTSRQPPSTTSRRTTVPTASINPVNIAFNQDVVAARFDAAVVEGGRRQRPSGEQRHPPLSELGMGARCTVAHGRSYPHPRRPRTRAAPPSSSRDVTPRSPSRRRAAPIEGSSSASICAPARPRSSTAPRGHRRRSSTRRSAVVACVEQASRRRCSQPASKMTRVNGRSR